MLSHFKWYRKRKGGHWEYWYQHRFCTIDPGAFVWINLPKCHLLKDCREITCGHMQCEEYGGKPIQ